jgi:hypothetical protein
MNREEHLLKLEEELLLTKSKAQVITLYLDALEEIKRLNNIIDGMERYFNNSFKNEVSVWELCLDKLKDLKEASK